MSPAAGAPRRARASVQRRALLAGLGLALAPLAAACSRDEGEEPAGPRPVTKIGEAVAAPSGKVSAVIDSAGDALGIVLRDADGEDIWADDFPYSRSQPPGIIWQSGADVLWVLSSAIGTARIAQGADGAWAKELADEEIPAEVERWR